MVSGPGLRAHRRISKGQTPARGIDNPKRPGEESRENTQANPLENQYYFSNRIKN